MLLLELERYGGVGGAQGEEAAETAGGAPCTGIDALDALLGRLEEIDPAHGGLFGDCSAQSLAPLRLTYLLGPLAFYA